MKRNYTGIMNPNIGMWVETDVITTLPYIQYDRRIKENMTSMDSLWRCIDEYKENDFNFLNVFTFNGGFIIYSEHEVKINTPIQLYIAFDEV